MEATLCGEGTAETEPQVAGGIPDDATAVADAVTDVSGVLRSGGEVEEHPRGVGDVTALTWALEIGDAQRFPSSTSRSSENSFC
jgi:hypothetical protein